MYEINLPRIRHNDKVKTGFRFIFFANVLKIKNWYHIYITIQTLYSVLCWSTFGSDYSLESSWVWRYNLGTPVFGEFLPFFSACPLKLCQVRCGASKYSYFQVSFRALAGPLKDIQRLVPKPLLHFLGCVLRVIFLLEGELWPQSEVLSRFSSRIALYFAQFIFASILTSLPVPAAEKHPHSMMLPPPCFTVGMVPGFHQTWHLAFKPKSSILVSSYQRISFPMVWESLGAFWQTPSGLSCTFHWGVASVWPLYHKVWLQRLLSF